MGIDLLEGRTLFAASANMVDGAVFIHGSSGADSVSIATSLQIHRSANRVEQFLNVRVNGTLYTFDAGAVKSIDARLQAGNDTLEMSDAPLSHYRYRGGVYRAVTENWTVNIDGGAGDDVLRGSPSDETLRGGDGDDTLDGGDGNDAVYGDNGNDLLDERGGVDRLSGGRGNDDFLLRGADFPGPGGEHRAVSGGAGHDRLFNEISTTGTTIDSIATKYATRDYTALNRSFPLFGWKPFSMS